jgi:hypothetical protein
MNRPPRGRAPEVLKKTQISQINTDFSVLIFEICVIKSNHSFEELNLRILKIIHEKLIYNLSSLLFICSKKKLLLQQEIGALKDLSFL